MKLVASTTPSSDTEFTAWIERQIVAESFGDWVTELAAISQVVGVVPNADDIHALLGDQMPQVMDGGLKGLAHDKLRILLQRPALLVELQRLVFVEGGEYWSRLLAENLARSEVEPQRVRLSLFLGPEAVLVARKTGSRDNHGRLLLSRRWRLAVSLLVLIIFLAIGGWYWNGVSWGPGKDWRWDWNEEMHLLSKADSREYLETLAIAAEHWFSKTPQNHQQFREKLEMLDQNLRHLRDAEHKQLSSTDRSWLVDSSGNWLKRCEQLMQMTDWEAAVGASDMLCMEVVNELHQRAEFANR